MSELCFNEKKATQLAAAFIERSGGILNYMKLIKLMYMADRAALIRWARPISGDAYLAMKHGPVLSDTYTMISDGQNPSSESLWFEFIERSGEYDVSLSKPCPPANLSEAEREVVNEVFQLYGHYDKWDLVRHLHEILPEWNHPEQGYFPISVKDILQAEGASPEEANQIEEELKGIKQAKVFLGCD